MVDRIYCFQESGNTPKKWIIVIADLTYVPPLSCTKGGENRLFNRSKQKALFLNPKYYRIKKKVAARLLIQAIPCRQKVWLAEKRCRLNNGLVHHKRCWCRNAANP